MKIIHFKNHNGKPFSFLKPESNPESIFVYDMPCVKR